MKLFSQVVILQKYLRRWLAKNRVNGVRMERMKRLEWEMNELRKEEEEKETEKARDKERRIHPTTKQDFDLLFDSLRSNIHLYAYIYIGFNKLLNWSTQPVITL